MPDQDVGMLEEAIHSLHRAFSEGKDLREACEQFLDEVQRYSEPDTPPGVWQHLAHIRAELRQYGVEPNWPMCLMHATAVITADFTDWAFQTLSEWQGRELERRITETPEIPGAQAAALELAALTANEGTLQSIVEAWRLPLTLSEVETLQGKRRVVIDALHVVRDDEKRLREDSRADARAREQRLEVAARRTRATPPEPGDVMGMDAKELEYVIRDWRLPVKASDYRGLWTQRGAVAEALSILDMYRTAAEASQDAEHEREEPEPEPAN
jgi:hypothetical protein